MNPTQAQIDAWIAELSQVPPPIDGETIGEMAERTGLPYQRVGELLKNLQMAGAIERGFAPRTMLTGYTRRTVVFRLKGGDDATEAR